MDPQQQQALSSASYEELQTWAQLVSQYIWTIETTKPNSTIFPDAYTRLKDIKNEIHIRTKEKGKSL